MKILLIVLASIGSLFVADNASAMIRPIKPDLTAHTFKLDCTPIVVPLLGAAYERYAPEYGVWSRDGVVFGYSLAEDDVIVSDVSCFS